MVARDDVKSPDQFEACLFLLVSGFCLPPPAKLPRIHAIHLHFKSTLKNTFYANLLFTAFHDWGTFKSLLKLQQLHRGFFAPTSNCAVAPDTNAPPLAYLVISERLKLFE